MENEKKSRREALKLLGKSGLFLGAVPVFFTSLNITRLDEFGIMIDLPESSPSNAQISGEKAFISGSESSLKVKVTGNPGRVFYVIFASTDIKENYRRIPGSDGVISARGSGSVVVNTKNIPNNRIYLKVITAEPNNVKSGLAETEAFMVTLKNGVMQTFDGTVGRPIMHAKYVQSSQVLIAMAAATQDKRIVLR